jgi:uncharacterized protein YbjT (DUF2867 family)
MYVITGASGLVGRPLVAALGGAARAVTRHPDAADLPAGVQVVAGDPTRPDTLDAALRGATGIFLNPRALGDASATGELLSRARRHGVTRVVALSAANADDDPAAQPSRVNGDRNTEVERAAVASGLEWVALRPAYFATNTIGLFGAQLRAGDTVRGPYPTFAEAPIDPADIAAVAAAALRGTELVGTRPVLTGPESLTQADLVAVLGEVLGRPLSYQEVPAAAARQAMVAHGLRPGFADRYLARMAAGVGRPAVTTADVEKVLGRPPRPFAEWAAGHADAFGGAA